MVFMQLVASADEAEIDLSIRYPVDVSSLPSC